MLTAPMHPTPHLCQLGNRIMPSEMAVTVSPYCRSTPTLHYSPISSINDLCKRFHGVEWIRDRNNFRKRERREKRRVFFFSVLLFFLSLSPSLPHFLPRPRVSLSLSLATEISFARRDFFFSLLLFFLSLSPSLPRLRVSLSLSRDRNFRREERFLFLSSLSFSSSPV